jgi:hypothetical protein
VLISSDRHGAAIGVIVSDARKHCWFSRFVSLATVLDGLKEKDPKWATDVEFIGSHGARWWNVHSTDDAGSTYLEEPDPPRPAPKTASSPDDSPTSSPSKQPFKTDIARRMESTVIRVRSYRRFLADWERGGDLALLQRKTLAPKDKPTNDDSGPPTVKNWRIKLGTSKVEGKRFVC